MTGGEMILVKECSECSKNRIGLNRNGWSWMRLSELTSCEEEMELVREPLRFKRRTTKMNGHGLVLIWKNTPTRSLFEMMDKLLNERMTKRSGCVM
ncbi:unnamed protein product [Arabidopsis thaliana]|uniref:Uncharacterized protein n=1 Tax=Arabidopsis thaliana TaxID=3702 RepID=A0A5S9WZK3_ARATH|nr:unnamed protein product [Arabidopsis thaliana]